MPRVIGMRCGTKVTCTSPLRLNLPSSWVSSGRWRWPPMAEAPAAAGVAADRFVDLAEVNSHAGRPARPTHTGLGVDHEVGRGKPGGDGGCQGEDGGGRVAAGDGDQLSVLELALVQLRNSKNGLREELRSGMLLAVVHRVLLRIVKPEVGAHVDHSSPGRQPPAGLARADVVRQTAEHYVEAFGVGLGLKLAFEIEQRKDLGVGLTRERPRGELVELHARMAGQQVDQGHSRVSVGAGHCNFYSPAHRRMSIQETAYP